MSEKPRCGWSLGSASMREYHDVEWGFPTGDDVGLFEKINLEGFQSGLSWKTVLDKRNDFRRVFHGFDVEKVARFNRRTVERLMKFPGIVRNRLKIESAISNAKAVLRLQDELGSLDRYLWSFVGGKPIVNRWTEMKQVPATSPESDALSKDLRKRGFKFVGSTIMYAHMQATGMVNDHVVSCFRYRACQRVK